MTPCRITAAADVAAITAQPYDDFIAAHSVTDALERVAQRHAERHALAYIAAPDLAEPAQVWTYARFIADVRRAANLFAKLADGAAARVAMLLPPIPQAHFTLWGGEAAGVVCPINFLLNSEHIAELIDAAQANILVALGPNPDLDIWSRVPALRAACPHLKHVLAVGGAPDAPDFDAQLRVMPGERLVTSRMPQRDDIAALFHTGGTTGAPKLAQHTHGNQLHASWSAAQMYAMDEHDVVLNGFPLFHVAGSFVYGLSALLSGAEVVLPTQLGLRNTAFMRQVWRFVERERVSVLATVPTVIAALSGIDPGGADLARVRLLLTGGSPLPAELAVAFEQRHHIPVRNILGMTECAGVISIEPFLAPRKVGSCGLPLPFTTVQATRPDGTVCEPDEPGVLRVRGPNVGPGYTDARRNAGTFSDDGWLITGDIGHVDAEGRVFVTGRAKDVIIRSSHNIDPGLIEEALLRHPEVQLAAAVGEPDEYAGEIPVAFVVLKPGAAVEPSELLAFVEPHIAERPALPKRIELLPALPLTAIGKVYKPALRARAIEHVLRERLSRDAATQSVQVSVLDEAKGLSAVFSAKASTAADARAAIARLMAPFAIAYRIEP
ncbi:MAG TPA: acyl-CoA synthetase [Burkholderiaceae bacterium]|nr:acyl-CoA synthetase [Burkholderiaceae bacterium]